jgi:formate dehydrogenase alpha subunit
VAGLATAFGSGAMTNAFPDLEEADVILITGSNTTEQHPIIGTRLIQMKEQGTRLIVADPRFIQIAQAADLYLRQKPGTDLAWLNGMMHVIIRDGLADEEFIRDQTEGFEELKQMVFDYTPEQVELISGIPAEKLVQAAHIYGEAESAAIIYAMGITQHVTGVQHVWQCANLAMLTGNVGKPGTGVNPLRGQNNVQGACDMGALPNVFPGYQSVTSAENRQKFQEAWGLANLDGEVGLTVVEMMHALQSGELKAMWVMGENPSISDPDVTQVNAALQSAEFLVVQDIFLSETARLADVVLPAASFAERGGTFTNTERRVQRVHKAIEPLSGTKSDLEIICQVARRMGAQGFDYVSPVEVMREINKVTPSYAGITYERLEMLGSLQWPCPTIDHPGTPYLHKGKFARGIGLFHPVEHQPPDEEPDDEYPFILTTGRLSFHYHTGTITRRINKLHHEVPGCYVEINPQDARTYGLNRHHLVRVDSRRGSIQAEARLTKRVSPGVIFIPFHFAEAAANVLTNPALDPVAKIPEYKVCAVKIEPVDG